MPLRVILALKSLAGPVWGRCGRVPVPVLVPAAMLEVRMSVVVESAAESAMVTESSRRRRTMQ